jgi:hypothetical protein
MGIGYLLVIDGISDKLAQQYGCEEYALRFQLCTKIMCETTKDLAYNNQVFLLVKCYED